MSKKYMGSDKGLIKLIELIKTRFEQLSCDDLKSVSTEANQGLSDTEKSNARANIGAAASSHTHSSYVNQNAFSNVAVGSTTVSADSATDTLTLVAGSNVTITPDATTDKITISATDTNTWRGITTSLTSTSTDVSLAASAGKSLQDQINTLNSNFSNYQPKGNYASASHNHSGVYQPVGSYASSSHNHDDRYYTESEINSAFAFKLYTGGLFGKYGEKDFVSEAYATDLLKIVSLHGYFTLSSVSNYQRVLLVQYWVFRPNQLITIPVLCHNDGQFAGVVTIDTNGDTYFISRCDYSGAVAFIFNTLYMYE